jgi:radical SAM superfamily enzyme YgiQ (UPF0313 family)
MKIALVAMSGIRVCDAELLELGLTLPGFVERSKTIASLPSLGLLTLAGLTPKDHEQEYLEVDQPQEFLDSDRFPGDYDLVAISTFTAQVNEAYRLADCYRAIGVPVVMGGLHVTSCPEEAQLHCDSIVIGEGEVVWEQLLLDAENSRLRPVYDGRNVEFDMKDAPMPDFGLLDMSRYNRLTVQTSRGCPHRCEFCASSILLSRHYKQKPAEKVLAEIDSICAHWDKPFIELADDNTFVDHAYWKKLLPEFAGRNLRWFTETDISVADDDELLCLLRQSGCAQLLIGLESPDPVGLRGLELNNDWKRKHWISYREAIDKIQSHGISVNGCFILGLDSQSPDIFNEVFEFVEESGLHEVQVTLLTPFPGTPLYSRLQKDGRLLDAGAWERCTLFDVNFNPARMSVNELAQGFRKLVVDLYSDEFTHRRKNRFRNCLKEVLVQEHMAGHA